MNEQPKSESPRTQPASENEELEEDFMTHQGEPLQAAPNQTDAQRHMGALEDNVSPIPPPTVGSGQTDDESDDQDEGYHPLTEITSG